MTRLIKLRVLGSVFGAAIAATFMASPADAQDQLVGAADDTPAGDDIAPAEIIVTAQRRSERLQDTPVSVTAFTGETLQQQEVSNLLNIARFTPNVEINNGRADGGGSSLNAYIRGVGQQDFIFPTDPGVGVYLDDVYLARTIGGTLDLSDVERLEVLRGPQGTLYGKNTIGGAIKIITRRPQVNGAWTGTVEATTGSFERAELKAFATGPLIEDVLGLKVAVAGIHRDGYGRRVLVDQDLGDQGKLIGRLALRWTPSPDWDITLSGDYQYQRQHGPVGTQINRIPSDVDLTGLATLLTVPFPGSPYGDNPPFLGVTDPTPQNPFLFDDFYNVIVVPRINQQLGLPAGSLYDARWVSGNKHRSSGTFRSRDDNDIWGVSLDASWDLAPTTTLRSITAYRRIDATFPRDGDHSPYPVVHTRNIFNQRQFSQELQLGGEAFGDRLNWLTGAYYMHETGFDDNEVDLFGGLFDVVNPVAPFLNALTPCLGSGATANCTTNAFDFQYAPLNKIKIDTYAFFAQGTFDVTDRLSFTLGGRYSKDKKRYTQDHSLRNILDPRFGPGQVGYTGTVDPIRLDGRARYVGPRVLRDSWDSFTPKVGIDFQATRNNLLYASWSKGFKSGGWSPRPTQQNNTDNSYDPETLSTYEIGSKNVLMNGRLIVNLAGFYSEYKDVQVTTIGSSANGALLLLTRNIGEAEIYGAEAEVTARPTDRIQLNLAGGYLHNRWKSFSRDFCNTAVFDQTDGRFCDVDLSLDDRLVDSPDWTFNGGAQYTLPIGSAGAELTFRSDASYRSTTWKDPFNLGRSPNAFGVVDPRVATPDSPFYRVTVPQLKQEGYWLVNLRLAFTDADRRWEFSAAVTNLFDKTYITSITPVTTFGYDEGYVGRPREWALSARYNF